MPRDTSHCCPNCDSTRVARSRLRSVDQVWRVLTFGRRPYRCTDCWLRFWEAPSRRLAPGAKPKPTMEARPSLMPGA